MMIFVVKVGVDLVKVGFLVKHAFVKPVIRAVVLTAVFAQTAEVAELYAERVRAAVLPRTLKVIRILSPEAGKTLFFSCSSQKLPLTVFLN